MNRKGQMGNAGFIIMVALTLIVGLILLQASAQEMGKATNTVVLENQSLGTMTNGTTLYVTNCKLISGVIIFNATGDVAIPSNNYTTTNNIVYNGALAVSVTPAVHPDFGYNKGTATIDGTCQPLGYIPESGGRAIVGVILIFFALALVVVALTPALRERVLEGIGR